jgi:hypothetical protein
MWEVRVHVFLGHNGDCCGHVGSGELAAAEVRLDEADYNSAMTQDDPPAAEGEPQRPRTAEERTWFDPNDVEEGDDALWEDIPSPSAPFGQSPPAKDEFDNPFVLIVDSSQLLSLPAVYCGCENAAADDLQFLDLQFFPASFKTIKTVFTFRCLDDFRLSNLECKTSAYQYFQRLRRLTNPAFPYSVPNRYAELRRVSRKWRNLKLWKWFGFGHRGEPPGRADMALFCAACPQPGVNLPPDWEVRYTEYVERRTLIVLI